MNVSFLPTADLADILGPTISSCDHHFFHYGKNGHACGKARTIRCFQDNLLIKQTLQTPGNGDILVVDGAASVHTALVGDKIATFAVENGWAGIIVYGAIRDSEILAGLPLMVKALGSNPRKSTQNGQGGVDVPITIANISIVPGDYIYSDSDGIVVVTESEYSVVQEHLSPNSSHVAP